MTGQVQARADSAERREYDPILDVTGVSGAEIHRRCQEIRSGRPHGAGEVTAAVRLSRNAGTEGWRLVDFGDGTDPDFVRLAHEVWLGRGPREEEMAERLAELEAGASRLHVMVRLAFTPEGRRERARPISGLSLRTLVAVGRVVERAAVHPVVGSAVRRVRPDLHAPGRSAASRRSMRRVFRVAVVAGATVSTARRFNRLERELQELTAEVHVLRDMRGR